MFKLITQQLGTASRLWMLVIATALIASQAKADASPALGMTVLGSVTGGGSITVFYPTSSASTEVKRGPFTLLLARDSQPVLGNRRLMVFSHGSGGAPWPMADLARSFVDAGYIVAMPEHEGDNWKDMRLVGPASWKLRPLEVSHAIDAMQQDSRFAPLIDFERVGVYGTSAGGLTALVLGGGKWSPANFKRYCLANMVDDFAACVGMIVQLNGNWADSIKLTLASWVHRLWFGDETLYGHQDPRIKAVLATVPMAVPFDLTTLAKPAVPTGLVVAGQDLWLAPQAHVRAVQAACTTCRLVLDLPQAGHGSLFSPWPAELAQSLTPMLVDPPGFVRADLPMLYKKMVAFFDSQLTPV
ncbi:MAG: dienelactone hydrolase [Polaromonas sp.]